MDISDEARRVAAERIEFLRSQFANLRVGWEKPEKLHLTLKFLGEIADHQLPHLQTAVETVAKEFQPFELKIGGAGVFPAKGRLPRVLWLGVSCGKQEMIGIQRRLETECAAAGFAREAKEFQPHLTIARLREPNNSRDLAQLHAASEFPAISFRAENLTIYQSELSSLGSHYTALAKSN